MMMTISVLAYLWWQYAVAWGSFIAIVLFLVLAASDVVGALQRLTAPQDEVDLTVQEMYRPTDPTIPVGEFNPKHIINGKARRK